MGVVYGVTTNPTIISREGNKFEDQIKAITEICTDGPVFAEVISLDADGMVAEGEKLAKIAKNIVIKIPM